MKFNISYEEAKKIILSQRCKLKTEVVYLKDSLNRYISKDIKAPFSNPRTDNSAMDGFAVRAEDIKVPPITLKVLDTIYAGQTTSKKLKNGEAIEIMTGAPIPEGANAVVPVEFTERRGNCVKVLKKIEFGDNVREKGEDYKKGELLIKKGTKLNPAHLALLASTGKSEVEVYLRPKIAILATGNELSDLSSKLNPGKIYDSNSYALFGQCEFENCSATICKNIRDSKESIKKAVLSYIKNEAIIITGGISMGKADYVKEALSELGAKFVFSKVRQRPGHPFTFAKLDGKPIFLLPGNPVSVQVCFEIYVKPFLRKLSGSENIYDNFLYCKIGETIKVKKGKTYFLRVAIKRKNEEFTAFLTGPQGSGIITSMAKADGILIVPEDCEEIKESLIFPVLPLSWRQFCF